MLSWVCPVLSLEFARNQFYEKIGFQQPLPKSNINSQNKQKAYTQSQQSNNYSQSKITTNEPINTQSQITVNPKIKSSEPTNNLPRALENPAA